MPLSAFVTKERFSRILDADSFINCTKLCAVKKDHLLSRAAYNKKQRSEKNSPDKESIGEFPSEVVKEIDAALRKALDLK